MALLSVPKFPQPHCTITHDDIQQIVPLLSQSSHLLPSSLDKTTLDTLINRIQFGGDEVVKAKDGAGSATLSMAYAGAEFTGKVIRALKGEKGIIVPTFINLSADKDSGDALKKELGKDIEYFSAPVELGVRFLPFDSLFGLTLLQSSGVETIKSLGNIADAEKTLIKAALPELAINIEKVS